MLCIKEIIESTQAPSFLTNYRIDMANFVDSHKVVIRRSAFLALLNAQNGGESEGGVEIGGLKHFHKWMGIWIYKKSLNWFPFQEENTKKEGNYGERQR